MLSQSFLPRTFPRMSRGCYCILIKKFLLLYKQVKKNGLNLFLLNKTKLLHVSYLRFLPFRFWFFFCSFFECKVFSCFSWPILPFFLPKVKLCLFFLGPYIFDSMSGNAYKYNFDKAALADLFARYVAQLRSCVNIYRPMNITENPRPGWFIG